VDGAHGARGPEGDPPLFDGRALAHDLLLRVASTASASTVPPAAASDPGYPLRIVPNRSHPGSWRRSGTILCASGGLHVLREALANLVHLRQRDREAVALARVLREEVLVVLLRAE